MVWMMEGRLLSVATEGEAKGRLSDCATCSNHERTFSMLKAKASYPSPASAALKTAIFHLEFCTWLATVSASGAQVTVEPLATGVSTRLVCPRSWQGRDCRTEAAGCMGLEGVLEVDWLVDDWELSWGVTTVKVWGTEDIVPLNIFFLASSTCHWKTDMLYMSHNLIGTFSDCKLNTVIIYITMFCFYVYCEKPGQK